MSRVFPRLLAMARHGRLARAPLFDAAWYLRTYPDLVLPDGRPVMDAALHYLCHGAAEGRDPGPAFSTSGYALQGGAGAALLHHIAHPGACAALPVFAGTGSMPAKTAPVVLFCGHQALGHQFGAERSFLDMLEHARGAGLDVRVVLPQCLDPGYLAAVRARARAVHLIPYGWRRPGQAPHPVTLGALCAMIAQSGAVAVHQNTCVSDAPLIAARLAGVPGIVHLRERPDQDADLCARLGQTEAALAATLRDQATRFVANSDATARWIDPDGTLAPGRVLVQPNAVDGALFDLPFAPKTPLRVALIGSNIAKKGVCDALEVARVAQRMGLDLRVTLIGPGTADLAALGPLPANMRHAGYALSPVAAMAQADVVLSLSHFAESFGRTVLEAMAAGRPVIAYARGTPPALIGPDGQAGFVVPPDDPGAVVRALLPLLEGPARLRAMSRAARARARTLCDGAAALPAARLYPEAFATRSGAS